MCSLTIEEADAGLSKSSIFALGRGDSASADTGIVDKSHKVLSNRVVDLRWCGRFRRRDR